MSASASMSDIIKQLELFSKTVSRVHDSGFVKDLKARGKIKYHMSIKKDGPMEVMKSWPEEDLVNGFLLPFRMLIQKNDLCSWKKIGELVEGLEIPAKYKDTFREARINLNKYLDKPIHVTFDGNNPTHRDVLYTFLYGYYAHTDKKYSDNLENWKKYPSVFGVLEFEFISIIILVSDLSYRMSEQINKPMIEFLRMQEHD